ncbi:MAG: ECF transporter S component [Clostridia bacterium]|nr:ECF transporter S component [Clostridia bacterium]
MKKLDVRKLVIAALLASFACVATMIIQIPNGLGGYFNLGDCIVLLCGLLLGPIYGAFAAGIGSMLADIFSSYLIYAPATFLIKALMAVIVFYVAKAHKEKGKLAAWIGAFFAELWMVLGYFLFEGIFLYGFGTALVAVVPNGLQGLVGIVCAILLREFIDKKGLWKH